MSVWAEVDALVKRSEDEFKRTAAELAQLHFFNLSVSDYGVWKAAHRMAGWVTARSGPELVQAAKRRLGEE